MKDDKRLRRKVRNSYAASTVSVMLVLFLLGTVGYLTLAVMRVAATLQQNIAVSVEIAAGLDEEGRAALQGLLSEHPMVRTVDFLSGEEKASDEEFRKIFGEDFEEILGENPLLDSFELTLTEASAEREALEGFIAEAARMPGAAHVGCPVMVAERLHATVGKIRLVLLLFGGALLIVSLILLNNTIRLAIYSKRYLINTMKLVGATKWFIMRPFLGSSITQGILAGLGASALFVAAVYGLNEQVPELSELAEVRKLLLIAGAMLTGGVTISGLFTATALNRFINMTSNKIHLY